MIKDRKIKMQQTIIEKLKTENQDLKKEIELIKLDLEFEKTFKNKEYDALKDLMEELHKEKVIYKEMTEKALIAKEKYEEITKEVNELKVKYSKEMKNLIKDIKKGI